MCAPSFFVPLDQFLRSDANRDQCELQVKPVGLEPKKEIDAEDDRKWRKSKAVSIAPRPAEQHIECVREEQLRQHEWKVVVDRMPIPTPVRENRSLAAGLQIMLFLQHDLDRRFPACPKCGRKDCVPQSQNQGGSGKCPKRPGITADWRKKDESRKSCGEHER